MKCVRTRFIYDPNTKEYLSFENDVKLSRYTKDINAALECSEIGIKQNILMWLAKYMSKRNLVFRNFIKFFPNNIAGE